MNIGFKVSDSINPCLRKTFKRILRTRVSAMSPDLHLCDQHWPFIFCCNYLQRFVGIDYKGITNTDKKWKIIHRVTIGE